MLDFIGFQVFQLFTEEITINLLTILKIETFICFSPWFYAIALLLKLQTLDDMTNRNVPNLIKLDRDMDLPAPVDENRMLKEIQEIANMNKVFFFFWFFFKDYTFEVNVCKSGSLSFKGQLRNDGMTWGRKLPLPTLFSYFHTLVYP